MGKGSIGEGDRCVGWMARREFEGQVRDKSAGKGRVVCAGNDSRDSRTKGKTISHRTHNSTSPPETKIMTGERRAGR